ncbi:MAG: hypothetical protein Q8N31_08750 [Reyranella sp.]|nr:hypothetical protein [Reyranella sp.]MDP3160090.1 hypothetical protein [Reyranella sp.]
MKHPQRWALLAAFVLVLGATGCATPAASPAAAPPTTDRTTAQLKARCSQLIAYFDRYAVGRSNDSDGRRNHTRLGAEHDCRRGLYAEGISTMEKLLRNKKFTPPPAGLPNVPEDDD